MRIFDTRKGDELAPGASVIYPLYGGRPDPSDYQLLAVEERWFSAVAKIRRLSDDVVLNVPLVVRFTHPSFFLQKVAFVPS